MHLPRLSKQAAARAEALQQQLKQLRGAGGSSCEGAGSLEWQQLAAETSAALDTLLQDMRAYDTMYEQVCVCVLRRRLVGLCGCHHHQQLQQHARIYACMPWHTGVRCGTQTFPFKLDALRDSHLAQSAESCLDRQVGMSLARTQSFIRACGSYLAALSCCMQDMQPFTHQYIGLLAPEATLPSQASWYDPPAFVRFCLQELSVWASTAGAERDQQQPQLLPWASQQHSASSSSSSSGGGGEGGGSMTAAEAMGRTARRLVAAYEELAVLMKAFDAIREQHTALKVCGWAVVVWYISR